MGSASKKTAHAAEQERPDVAARRLAWFARQPDLDPNKLVNVDRNKIESMGPSKISMMPDGLIDTLNHEEILDLVAYLYSRGDRNHKAYRRD